MGVVKMLFKVIRATKSMVRQETQASRSAGLRKEHIKLSLAATAAKDVCAPWMGSLLLMVGLPIFSRTAHALHRDRQLAISA